MARPTAKPALTKAPIRVHPVAPAQETPPVVPATESDVTPTPVEAPTPPPAADSAEERKVMYSARIRESLRRQVKRHAADTDLTIEEITEAALTEYLKSRSQQA